MIKGLLVSLLVLTFTSCAYSNCDGDDGSCLFKDLTYTNNEIFTLDGQSKCIKYKCVDTVVSVHEAGCEMNDECYAEGASTTSNCNTYECQKTMVGDKLVYKMEMTGDRKCNVSNVCRPLDTEFNIGCNVYKCATSGSSWTLETVTKKCNVSNVCRPLDTDFNIGCDVYKCASSGSSWTLETVAKKCNVSNVCRPLDTNFDIGCTVYKCATSGSSWTLEKGEQKCPGPSGSCHPVGESFSYPPYGTCTCSIDANSKVNYQCQ